MQLGELERLVLQYLWQHESADAKQVFHYFEKTRGGSLNTIQSTLERLFKKELLTRHKEGHAFQYQAKVEKHQLIAKLIQSVTHDLVSDEDTMVAAFSSVSREFSEEQLDKLEALIEQQRKNLENNS